MTTYHKEISEKNYAFTKSELYNLIDKAIAAHGEWLIDDNNATFGHAEDVDGFICEFLKSYLQTKKGGSMKTMTTDTM